MVQTAPFSHKVTSLSVPGGKLADTAGLPALALAAAGAMGLSTFAPPLTRSGPRGVVVGLLCHGGHIVLHAIPEQSLCIVDILAFAPSSAERGVDVIAKRLTAPG